MTDRHANRPKCEALKDDGSLCQSTALMDDGHCVAHSEHGGSEEMAERGRRGGISRAVNADRGRLEEEDLPPLETPSDVKAWLRVVNRAVATGRISTSQANSITRGLRSFLKAHREEADEERLVQAEEKIERLEKQLSERPALQVES